MFLKLYYDVMGGMKDLSGMMGLHQIDTSSIQVAGDGKTAKGVWFSPGANAIRMGEEFKSLRSEAGPM